MDIRKLMEAEMALMEGKDLVMASNYPGSDVLSVCEHAYKRLGDYIEKVKQNPEEYKKDGDDKLPIEGVSRYQLEIKLVRLKDEYFQGL